METNTNIGPEILRREFEFRKGLNSSYSLRAYARDLEIDSSNLSAVLKGKRFLSKLNAEKIASKLRLSPEEKNVFIMEAIKRKSRIDKIKVNQKEKKYLFNEHYHEIIADPDYYSFLKLLELNHFQSDEGWLCQKLNLKVTRLREIIKKLKALELISGSFKEGFKRLCPKLETSEDVVSNALQTSHLNNLELAKRKLLEVPVRDRDYSSINLKVNTKKLDEAKVIIREFQDKLEALFEEEVCDEVYLLSTQFFPITTKSSNFKGEEYEH